jgi:peptidoglycan/LPS O-acetylase OafA/YrhL
MDSNAFAHMARSSSGRFRELDVLRGIAALTVVFFHYTRHGTRYFTDYPFDFWPGEYGVHLFFVISGFVIYYTIERSRSVGDFLFSRFSRLYPTYWTALGLLFLWALLDPAQKVWWPGYVVNVTMLQKFVHYPDVDNVYWTLAVELVFYAVMSLVFLFGQMRRIALVGIGWLAAGLVWGTLHHFSPDERTIGTTYFILPYAPYFVAGTMFYQLYSRGMDYLSVATIVLAAAVAWAIAGTTVGIITIVIFALFAAAVLGWLRFLINPVTLWLGAISYPLYLVHRLPAYAFLDWMNARHASPWLTLAIAVSGALMAAHVLAITVERPAMRVLRQWYRARRAPAIAQA